MDNNKKELSKEWWESFLKESDNLQKAISVDNAFSDATSDEMLANTLDVFKDLDESARFRIWVNGKQREDLLSKLIKNPPKANEDLKTWTNRLFGMEKFGIIFNNGECWSQKFTTDIYNRVKPLLEKLGYPSMGIDITIFIGNYGWTPLGIHMDYIGESVLHMHLGPHKKDMYLWDKELYMKDMKGKLGEDRPEFFEEKAFKYEINKGGVFFMPWGMPHIGKTDDLSVGISIWLNKPTRQKMLKKIVDNVSSEFIIAGSNTFSEQQQSYEDNSTPILTLEHQKDIKQNLFEELIQDAVKKETINDLSFSDLLKMNTLDYQYALKSNLHFTLPLNKKKVKEPFFISEDTLISLDHPYQINWYHSNISKKLHLFIKGNKTMLNYHEDIVTMIKRINSNRTYSIDTLMDELFVDWPDGAAQRILEILHEQGALILENQKELA